MLGPEVSKLEEGWPTTFWHLHLKHTQKECSVSVEKFVIEVYPADRMSNRTVIVVKVRLQMKMDRINEIVGFFSSSSSLNA